MIGRRVSFRTTDSQILWNSTFGGQIFMTMLEKSCYRTCPSLYKILLSMGIPFYTHDLSRIIPENVSKH